ncbi:hypothetical protein BLOT_002224 [Blomia tropicalis]|nr:hypothetical protein BLOT_002224 [Blomia tropicalis]
MVISKLTKLLQGAVIQGIYDSTCVPVETGIFHQNRRTISNMVGVRFRNIQLYEAIRAIISLSMSCNQLNNIEKLDRIMVDYMDLEITP